MLDGAVIINLVRPTDTMKTFHDYIESGFIPYIHRQLNRSKRIDIIWDTYEQNSLKSYARQKRGTGIHIKVTPKTTLPKKWSDFLHCQQNKEQLFKLLAMCILQIRPEVGVLVTTMGKDASCNDKNVSMQHVCPTNQEEADTRLILHAQSAVNDGHIEI